MNRIAFAVSLLVGVFVSVVTIAADPEVVELWPGKVPGDVGIDGQETSRIYESPIVGPTKLITNVTTPTLTVYLPPKEKNTGTAMIICPGGGYHNLFWELEGEEVAAWLNSAGMTGIILKYRCPRRPGDVKGEPPPGPTIDAQRAVSLVRSKAAAWGIDPQRIGMVGFSAGGHLVLATATSFGTRTYEPVDAVDQVSCRPDFGVACYSGYLKAKDKDEIAAGLHIPADTPPIFLAHASDDSEKVGGSISEHSAIMYIALKRAGVPAELHIYASGNHDFGVRQSEKLLPSSWPQLCVKWLRSYNLLAADNSPAQAVPSQSTGQVLRPVVKVVEGGESKAKPEDCRTTLLGPGVNQPDPFPGYGGFVGWISPIRLKSGDWLAGFSAGYWHASAPTPLRFSRNTIAEYHKMGMPADVVAPTGGRAMIMRSSDEGKTWSKPVTLLDTPDDDRHPAFVELPDGTLICSLFTYPGADSADHVRHPELAHRTAIIRSFDQGKTWEQDIVRLPSPFLADETDGPMVLLKDGAILLTISGTLKEGGPEQAAVFTSRDRGASWKLLSTVKSDHNLDEANATQLPDGRLILIARPEGDVSWSPDQGRTWTAPVTFGMRLYAPSLYVLRDGTLVCLHGSYAPGHSGLRLIFSTDGGQTWIAPAKDHGFLVDNCYGYGKAFELPDGSLLVIDQDTGGHTTADAKRMSLRCLRVRIRPDHSGIDLLPANG